jgi:hypothetical protein
MTPLFGPGWGNYAIRGIVEIKVPEAVSLWPATPGWWALLALLLTLLLRAAWRRGQRWHRNRYRREALLELARLRERLEGGDAAALRELAPLLRAAALQAAGRRSGTARTGDAWAAQLAGLAPGTPPPPVATLHRLAYAPLPDSAVDWHPLVQSIDTWLRAHRGPDA